MSKEDEVRAAELLDAFLHDAARGRPPVVQTLLERCPRNQREHLQLACEGVAYMVKHYCFTHVREEVVKKTFQQVQEIRRRRQALAEADERSRQQPDIPNDDPGLYLANILGTPSLSLTSQATVTNHPGVTSWHRGGLSGDNSRQMSELTLQVEEQVISAQAEDLLMNAMIEKPPVDVQAVAAHLCLFVKEATLSSIDGCLVSNGEVGGILINRRIVNKERKRFTLAHEIGHFIRHRHLQNQFNDQMGPWGSRLYTETEREADTFAAMLLMPSMFLPDNFGSERPSWTQAEQIASMFEVSRAAAFRRMIRASHWRCALMVLRNGIIEYSVRSPMLEAYDRRGQKPHPTTAAARLHDAEPDTEAYETLPAQVWFDGPILEEEEIEVQEVSRRLQNGYIYSLVAIRE